MVDKIKIDDLYLDFTLPGFPEIELVPNGSQMKLSIENVDLYLDRVIDVTLVPASAGRLTLSVLDSLRSSPTRH